MIYCSHSVFVIICGDPNCARLAQHYKHVVVTNEPVAAAVWLEMPSCTAVAVTYKDIQQKVTAAQIFRTSRSLYTGHWEALCYSQE